MIKTFLDTNIMLDFLGEREPFYLSSAKIVTLADKDKIKIIVSALSFHIVGYFLTKYYGLNTAKDKLRKFKVISTIAELDKITIEKALNSNFKDFEDALQYYCASQLECDIFITRNVKDFKHSDIPVLPPDDFLINIKK